MDKKYVLIGFAVVLGLGTGLGVRLLLRRGPLPAAVSPATADAPSPAAPLPALDDSEGLVRARAEALSSDGRWRAWLKTDAPLRRAAAAVELVASGKIPRDALAFLGPRGKFPIERVDGEIHADPAGYARYDRVAEVFASLDAAAAAALLRDLSPLFEQACREFGGAACAYPDAFARAAGHLLQAPAAEKEPRLKAAEKGIVFAYADDRLERLSPAQKQLLRMGPRNQALISAKLREILAALAPTNR